MRSRRLIAAACGVLVIATSCSGHHTKVLGATKSKAPHKAVPHSRTAPTAPPGVPKVILQSGTAYQNGVSMIWQNWTGDIALVLSGIFIVPIMRRLRIRSVPEFLELRYSKSLRVLMGAFGSADPRQIDGVGGATPTTSKAALVRPGVEPNVDVDYTFRIRLQLVR